MSYYEYKGYSLSKREFRKKDKETQIYIMNEWFEHHFEDPADLTPYIDGEYVYIDGGPYHPYDVLKEKFYEFVPENVIRSLANKLEQIQIDWAPITCNTDYDDYEIDSPLNEFTESMKNINILLSNKFHNTHSDAVSSMHRLLYANIIIAIEVYLSDTFKNEIKNDPSAIRRFVETTPAFNEQIFSISNIYQKMASIENRVNNYHANIIWHRIDKIKKIYTNTFRIKFPENTNKINDAIIVRHDIVHRNGKTKNGAYHIINELEVKYLINEARKFVTYIERQILTIKLD